MAESAHLLEVRGVEIRRGERQLIQNLSFALDEGQNALIVGPNGSGKTTFLRVLAGLAPCADGEILFDGIAIDRLEPEQRSDVSYKGHLDGLKQDLSVGENLSFYAELRGRSLGFGQVLEELKLVSLKDRAFRHLSAGQRRRVGLAALKISQAKLWILDEPMTNLDSEGRGLVSRWLREHLAAGGLAVVATHQPDELATSGTLLVEL